MTICVKCRHCLLLPSGRRVKRARCIADWPKKMDFVTGAMSPTLESCSDKNPRGRCTRYEERLPNWVQRLWKHVLNAILETQKDDYAP